MESVSKKWTHEEVYKCKDGSEVITPLEGEYSSRRALEADLRCRARQLRATAPGFGTITPVNIISPSGKRYPFTF